MRVLFPQWRFDALSFRPARTVALVACSTVLTFACGVPPAPRVERVVSFRPAPLARTTRPAHLTLKQRLAAMSPKERAAFRRLVRAILLARYVDLLWHATYDIPADLVPVANCVKGVESGDPNEQSHPSSGSGTYQFIPTTWRTWFGRWRVATPAYKGPDYAFAFLAPWFVQDAVFVFTLRNGGEANWSGVDGCTGH